MNESKPGKSEFETSPYTAALPHAAGKTPTPHVLAPGAGWQRKSLPEVELTVMVFCPVLGSVLVGASRFANAGWLRHDKALHAMLGIAPMSGNPHTPGGGGNAGLLFERAVELRNGSEAAGKGDIEHPQVFLGERLLRVFDAAGSDVMSECLPGACTERAAEVGFAESQMLRDSTQVAFGGAVVVVREGRHLLRAVGLCAELRLPGP